MIKGNAGSLAGSAPEALHRLFVGEDMEQNLANNDNTTFDGSSDDHGTHVSGTIGGIGGNGKGVAGVNWSVKLISAKFLGRNAGEPLFGSRHATKAID